MIIRRPRLDELDKLLELHHKELSNEFPFPDLKYISSMCVVGDDDIVGFGIINPIFESIVILDRDKSKDKRIEALKMLIEQCEFELKSQDIKQYHAFVQDNKFKNLLTKRFGFEDTKGRSLVKVI